MALTSRKKRPLNRAIPHLRDTRLIVIAAEGEKTETQYFGSPLFQSTRVQVHVLETEEGKSSPAHVMDRLKKFIETTILLPDDQLWLVVDKDRWPTKQLSEVCRQMEQLKKHKGGCAVSNPNFELWLYLHHFDWDSSKKANKTAIISNLKDKPGGFNKTKIKWEDFKNGMEDAIKRARALDAKPESRWPANPGTRVYRAVEEIKKLMG